MYNLFLDDDLENRHPDKYYPSGTVFVRAINYKEAVDIVLEKGIPDFISFDHDLGDISEDEKSGYSFAKFLIDYMLDNNITKPFKYFVHSANPVGRVNIETYLENGFHAIRRIDDDND